MLTNSMSIRNNVLYYQNKSIIEILEKYGSPIIIYDLNEFELKIKHFKNSFSSNQYKLNLCYASKAFICKKLTTIISEHNMYIDSVSLGDLLLLKKAKFNLKKVFFHGNNKSKEELKFAIKNDVVIVVDNMSELENIIELSKEKKVRTLFRVNTHIEVDTHEYIRTALSDSKFGESIYLLESIDTIIDLYKKNPQIELLGFHSHIGSQILKIKPYIQLFDILLDFTNKMNIKHNLSLKMINFGGGFGTKYLETDETIDLRKLGQCLEEKIQKYNQESTIKIEEIFFEPGRYLISGAGSTFYEVGFTKTTIGKKNYLFVNGGMNDNIRPALYQAVYTVKLANRFNNQNDEVYDVVGKCCESGDIIKKDCLLPKACPKDIVMVFSTGAYCYSMSSNYNNNLKPLILYCLGNKIDVLVKKQKYSDLFI